MTDSYIIPWDIGENVKNKTTTTTRIKPYHAMSKKVIIKRSWIRNFVRICAKIECFFSSPMSHPITKSYVNTLRSTEWVSWPDKPECDEFFFWLEFKKIHLFGIYNHKKIHEIPENVCALLKKDMKKDQPRQEVKMASQRENSHRIQKLVT